MLRAFLYINVGFWGAFYVNKLTSLDKLGNSMIDGVFSAIGSSVTFVVEFVQKFV